jgi:hypothetical protein
VWLEVKDGLGFWPDVLGMLQLVWGSGFVMVQVDGIGLAIGPPAPARGKMGLAWVRARRKAVTARRMVIVAFVCWRWMLVLDWSCFRRS